MIASIGAAVTAIAVIALCQVTNATESQRSGGHASSAGMHELVEYLVDLFQFARCNGWCDAAPLAPLRTEYRIFVKKTATMDQVAERADLLMELAESFGAFPLAGLISFGRSPSLENADIVFDLIEPSTDEFRTCSERIVRTQGGGVSAYVVVPVISVEKAGLTGARRGLSDAPFFQCVMHSLSNIVDFPEMNNNLMSASMTWNETTQVYWRTLWMFRNSLSVNIDNLRRALEMQFSTAAERGVPNG